MVARRARGDRRRPPPRAHEVVTALAPILDAEGAATLDRAVAARRWDIYTDPFEDEAHFADYLDATSGHLMWTAARALGAPPETEPVVRDFAWGAGLAAFLRAIPELEARGRKPLPDGRPGAIQTLAREGLQRIARARRSRHGLPTHRCAGPLPGLAGRSAPAASAADPTRVAKGTLGLSEFSRRARLLAVGLSGAGSSDRLLARPHGEPDQRTRPRAPGTAA
jgi:15-cis-phytoene synthase